MEEKCNIPLYSTSGLMHIVRYVFIGKIYGGSRPAVAVGCFSFFNCRALTCQPRDFSPHSTTFMWVLIFYFFSFFFSFSRIMRRSKKGEKMCETQFKALSITLTWPTLPSIESFPSLKEPKKNPWPLKTVLNLLLLSLQHNYFTLLPRPLEPSSHSLCHHIYISILIIFTTCCCTLWKCHWILWSVHMQGLKESHLKAFQHLQNL